MRIAFYAPMKSPDHPVPSGDRRMARLLMAALRSAGHTTELMSELRTFDGDGDHARQVEFEHQGRATAEHIVADFDKRTPNMRPDAWLTYHLHYKAPDWIGPQVCDAAGIPYIVAEASHAPKRAGGPWHHNHQAVERTIRRADAVIGVTRHDMECVAPLAANRDRLFYLPPFIDGTPYAAARPLRSTHRKRLAEALSVAEKPPWLLTVAMMRPGDKCDSYACLAQALQRIADRNWRLIVVGDGPARPAVEAMFQPVADKTVFAGQCDVDALPAYYAASDLFVWPGIGEAYGMAYLEAQATGLPVVAGNTRGVPDVVVDGAGGLLARAGDPDDFADKIAALLDDRSLRADLSRRGARFAAETRSVHRAGRTLDQILSAVVPA